MSLEEFMNESVNLSRRLSTVFGTITVVLVIIGILILYFNEMDKDVKIVFIVVWSWVITLFGFLAILFYKNSKREDKHDRLNEEFREARADKNLDRLETLRVIAKADPIGGRKNE
jgi:hypothetical protein